MITIVSGLPRSGTSLMMQMLHSGGLPILCDDRRPADDHNPRGYFEFQPVRSLERDASWMPQAEGKGVKIVSLLVKSVPDTFEYRVLFMRRSLDEVLMSQERMLAGLGRSAGPDRESMRRHFESHLESVDRWLASRANIRVLNCEHSAAVRDPLATSRTVAEFLERSLDVEAMARSVAPELHRQKR